MRRELLNFIALIILAVFCVFAGGCGKGDDDGADHADRGRRASAGNESDPGQDDAGTDGNGAGNAAGSDSNGARNADVPLFLFWHSDRMIEAWIRDDLNERLLEGGNQYTFSSSNVRGSDSNVAYVELLKPDDYLGDIVDCRIMYRDASGEEKWNYSCRKDSECGEGYHIYKFYEGLVEIPYRPDDIINELMPYPLSENVRYYCDYSLGADIREIREGVFRYRDDFDAAWLEPWRNDIDKIISIEDFEKLGEIPESFVIVQFTIPEVAHCSFTTKEFYNELGVLIYRYKDLRDLTYVPVTVTRVYILDDFGKVQNTAEILQFPTAEDAVSFDPHFHADDYENNSDMYYYVPNINDADTYGFRKRVMEEKLRIAGLTGTIEEEKMYFPYNFEDYASCWGENLLQCYGIRDESGEQIDETSVSGYLDENGYFELDGGTIEYIKESMWDWHGAPQVDDAYVSEPTDIRMYVYRKD